MLDQNEAQLSALYVHVLDFQMLLHYEGDWGRKSKPNFALLTPPLKKLWDR